MVSYASLVIQEVDSVETALHDLGSCFHNHSRKDFPQFTFKSRKNGIDHFRTQKHHATSIPAMSYVPFLQQPLIIGALLWCTTGLATLEVNVDLLMVVPPDPQFFLENSWIFIPMRCEFISIWEDFLIGDRMLAVYDTRYGSYIAARCKRQGKRIYYPVFAVVILIVFVAHAQSLVFGESAHFGKRCQPLHEGGHLQLLRLHHLPHFGWNQPRQVKSACPGGQIDQHVFDRSTDHLFDNLEQGIEEFTFPEGHAGFIIQSLDDITVIHPFL